MKWKYIGNRTGDATKGEQYIVEADELTENYMKTQPYPQYVKVYLVQPSSPRNNLCSHRTGDIIKICNPYYEMATYSHPGFVPVKE